MLQSAFNILRQHPEIALFLTLALGYVIGQVRVMGHPLGLVSGSLFAGLLIGQIGIELAAEVKTIFLLLFLFANGYGAGPQFFRALRADGVKPLLLTLVVCFTGLLMVWMMARLMRLDVGFSAGLLSGSLTQSPAMGTAIDAIMGLNLPPAEKQALANHVPVADAVCYLFGFWGEVLYVAMLLPRMLGIDLRVEAKRLETELGLDRTGSGLAGRWQQSARAFRLTDGRYGDVAAIEAAAMTEGYRLFVARIRRDAQVLRGEPAASLRAGDVVVLAGTRSAIVGFSAALGPELDDPSLTDTQIDSARVIVTKADIEGRELGELARDPVTRGVFLSRITRAGQDIPVTVGTRLQRGDELVLFGEPERLDAAARQVGWIEKTTLVTDMLTLGIGIALGCLIGLPSVMVGSVSLALSTSVGTLLMGLLFGWLRAVRPMALGTIPEASRLFMVNFGLAGFVAMTGLHAGPVFLPALQEVGIALFIAGVICTCVPPTVGALFGKHVLKMNPVLMLGGVAGAQTMTAAMVAVQERAESRAPILGFTVPYALGNILLTTFGTVIVLLLA